MAAVSEKWSDLSARTVSAVLMIVLGLGGIVLGGHVFHLLVAVICGLMVWELVGMVRPNVPAAALGLGVFAGGVSFLAAHLPGLLGVVLLLVPAGVGYMRLVEYRRVYAAYTVVILLAGLGMVVLRDGAGFGWMLWLVGVVVVTDVFGYFAGRIIGGPKFWPRISPKKTWSGTVAGWIGAALLGGLFAMNTGFTGQLVLVSVLVSMASQMGDVTESALKRKTGVKDSSALIPGHGGLLDRFDGMLGASLFVLVIGLVFGFPPGLG